MAKPFTWHKISHKISNDDFLKAEGFLRSREDFCTGACSKILSSNFSHIWTYNDDDNEVAALMLHSRSSLFPVFSNKENIPLPDFFGRFLRKVNIYSVQGLSKDVKILEKGMEDSGFIAADTIDYDLMTLNTSPPDACFENGPEGLILRPPLQGDKEELFQLHSAYEKEEVIPRHGFFNSTSSRKTLERLLSGEKMLIAVLGSKIAGKINTNAKSYSKYQIGGVYVLPEFRGLGIAKIMSAAFIRELLNSNMGVNLFVKKRNIAANKLYKRLGFSVMGDYRISYY